MRPSGSGATGKGMGPAAECCLRQKVGAILGPSGRPEGERLWPAPVLPSVNYQPGDAPCWEDSARRPDSASALRVCCGTRPAGWFCNASAPSGFGSRCRGWTATPLVASLLPLAVRAGARAFAGLVGIRKVTLTARPHRQGVPSMIPPLLGFVGGGTAPPNGRASRSCCLVGEQRSRAALPLASGAQGGSLAEYARPCARRSALARGGS